MPEEMNDPAWHQALAYAVTGQRLDELGRQRRPDVARLAEDLQRLATRSDVDLTWSVEGADHLVPADLIEGIGAAQFWAVLADLRRALGVAAPGASPVMADRPLTTDERRLVGDRPPHH